MRLKLGLKEGMLESWGGLQGKVATIEPAHEPIAAQTIMIQRNAGEIITIVVQRNAGEDLSPMLMSSSSSMLSPASFATTGSVVVTPRNVASV